MNNNDPLFNASDIVKRAKQVMGFKTDSELAAHLGISRSTLSNWCARNSIDFALMLSKLNKVDYNWLLTGKGTPTPQQKYCNSELASGKVEILHNAKTPEMMDDRSVPLYDISAAANLKSLLIDKCQYKVGDIQIPGVPSCDGALYISGDSMYPILRPGDIVGFKETSSLSSIIYGEIYLISFHIDGDDYLVAKLINRSEQPGCIKLMSYNKEHEPMDLPLTSIYTLAIIKFSIRKNMMM